MRRPTVANYLYSYDDADRITKFVLPSGSEYKLSYDPNGNITSITTPNEAVHKFAYNAFDLEAAYTSPLGYKTAWEYDSSGRLMRVAQPDGRAVDLQYACEGFLLQEAFPEGAVRLEHHPETGRLTRISRLDTANKPVQEAAFAYDGGLLLSETWQGAVEAQILHSYNADFQPVSLKLQIGSAEAQIPVGRDADGLITKYGPFEFKRNGPNGAVSSIGDGVMELTHEYDALGRLVAKTCSVARQQMYRLQIEYDALGRISRRVETVGGSSHTYQYAYDADGQLIQVLRDGSLAERYEYDPNGNRTLHQLGAAASERAEYDLDNRVLRQGNTTYGFSELGLMVKREGDSFVYSTKEELLRAVIGGRDIQYAYDGYGRRVARTEAGAVHQFIYANQDNQFEITACRYPDGTLDLFFYDDAGRLFAVQRAGAVYYVATDQVGTPRAVADASGRIVKVLEYSSFGEILADSNPGFQLPIGFASGLTDPSTGLVLFGWRDYDPNVGRWTTRDPIFFEGNSLNLYVYLGNDPLLGRDPSGLQDRRPIKPHSEYIKLTKQGTDRATDSVEPFWKKIKRLWEDSSNALCGEETSKPKPSKKPKELPKFKR
ncbi:MAG: RHS repeat-associated core domain-containing protein [Armatimonadota bacterium]